MQIIYDILYMCLFVVAFYTSYVICVRGLHATKGIIMIKRWEIFIPAISWAAIIIFYFN